MLTINLPALLERRLTTIASRSKRTKSSLAREAILIYLEELKDIFLAERALSRIRSGRSSTIPLSEIVKRHSLLPSDH
jgi:RHH-type transcriptional regulator, rel operon repressor / antitoxin RelB